MNPFKSKQRFRKLSILILVSYFVLCMTAGGFHAFDESAYHNHTDNYHSENTVSVINGSGNSTPILCDNDHSEDNCIICKWLKHTPKKVQLPLDVLSFIPYTSGLCLNEQQTYCFLNYGKYHSRSPPLTTS
jgi:hypothetical protein